MAVRKVKISSNSFKVVSVPKKRQGATPKVKRKKR